MVSNRREFYEEREKQIKSLNVKDLSKIVNVKQTMLQDDSLMNKGINKLSIQDLSKIVGKKRMLTKIVNNNKLKQQARNIVRRKKKNQLSPEEKIQRQNAENKRTASKPLDPESEHWATLFPPVQ